MFQQPLLLCGFSCVTWGSDSGWSFCCKACTCTVSPRCGSSCALSGRIYERTSSRKSRKQTASGQSGPWGGSANWAFAWRTSRSQGSGTASPPCGSSCGWSESLWWWTPCCTRRSGRVSPRCASSGGSAAACWSETSCSRYHRGTISLCLCVSSRVVSESLLAWNASRTLDSRVVSPQSASSCGAGETCSHWGICHTCHTGALFSWCQRGRHRRCLLLVQVLDLSEGGQPVTSQDLSHCKPQWCSQFVSQHP